MNIKVKTTMVSIRISDEERKWIDTIRRFDEDFNCSEFFRKALAAKVNAIKEKIGVSDIGFYGEKQAQKTVPVEAPVVASVVAPVEAPNGQPNIS